MLQKPNKRKNTTEMIPVVFLLYVCSEFDEAETYFERFIDLFHQKFI
jgi:outer membrane protein assembly factor BamD (BamD/ComL family)